MSFKKLNLALLVLFLAFFFTIFSFHYRQTLQETNKVVTGEMRRTLVDMALDLKGILQDKDHFDVKAYLDRKKASSPLIQGFYVVKKDGTLISTSDNLYAQKSFSRDDAIDLRQIQNVNIADIDWIHSFVSVPDNNGIEEYILYVKLDHPYIVAMIQERMMMHMFYPILFFVGLALFYLLYIKRMIIKPVMLIDAFLRGVINKIPKFYIVEFNNLAKNLEHNLNTLRAFAYTDGLTGLHNRKGMENIVKEQILEYQYTKEGFALAMLDLDHFKKVNDTSGHDVGDALLQEVSKALKSQLKEVDKIGRLGGDEFLLLFEHESTDSLSHRLDNIVKRFSKPFIIQGHELYIEASMGVVIYPEDGDTLSNLLKHADMAMYEAKKAGGNRFSFFSKALGEQIRKELLLENDIKKALHKDEFYLVYQPIIDAKSEKIVSVEALARWEHPQKGMVFPSDFIPTIENGCCVKEFGEWVINTACAQQRQWLKEGIDIKFSLNLSVKHIMSPNFRPDLEAIMQKHHADLNKVVFEITEYALMEYRGATVAILNEMEQKGYQFTLDDFGTGYSSITYLQNTPITAVKIDKSFIDEIESDKNEVQMLDAIISLTKVIGLPSIAEGVEHPFQAAYLKSAGCDMIQGYLYSKPLTSQDFAAYYKAH